MLRFQRYLFANTAHALGIILSGLALLALLAQGLSWTDLIHEDHQSIGLYLKIIWLGAPKILALLIPVAVFVATVWSLNHVQKDGEIMVVQATGMSNRQIAAPLVWLGVLALISHLMILAWVQPAAQQALRMTLQEARTDLATALIRPGEFTSHGAFTFYARQRSGSELYGLLISDNRTDAQETDYLARIGTFSKIDGIPTLLLRQGRRFQKDAAGKVSILDFERYRFDVTDFIAEDQEVRFEPGDLYFSQLLSPYRTGHSGEQPEGAYLAEIHNRLSAPLLNLAMIMLAISASLGGTYSKHGYAKRISVHSVAALGVMMLHIAAFASAEQAPMFNIFQWLVPVLICLFTGANYFSRKGPRRTRSVRQSA